MNANISSLLRLSRKEHNQSDLTIFNLSNVISEVIDDLQSSYNKNLKIKTKYIEKCILKTDKVLTKMLIRNLLQNSLQHTFAITTVILHGDRLIIKDVGSGLPDELTSSLKQLSPERTLKNSKGLGLYIVTLICERLGWELNLSQEYNIFNHFEIVFMPSIYQN